MSDSSQTRRSFLKGSVSKSLMAANAGIVVGLINTPGIVGALVSGAVTTQPGATAGLVQYASTIKMSKDHIVTTPGPQSSTKQAALELLEKELKNSGDRIDYTPHNGSAAQYTESCSICKIGTADGGSLPEYDEPPENPPAAYILYTKTNGQWRAGLHTSGPTSTTIYTQWLKVPGTPLPQ